MGESRTRLQVERVTKFPMKNGPRGLRSSKNPVHLESGIPDTNRL